MPFEAMAAEGDRADGAVLSSCAVTCSAHGVYCWAVHCSC